MKTSKIISFFSIFLLAISLGMPGDSYAGGGGKKKTYKWCFILKASNTERQQIKDAWNLSHADFKLFARKHGFVQHKLYWNDIGQNIDQYTSQKKCFHSRDKKLDLQAIVPDMSGSTKNCDVHNNASDRDRWIRISTYYKDWDEKWHLECDA